MPALTPHQPVTFRPYSEVKGLIDLAILTGRYGSKQDLCNVAVRCLLKGDRADMLADARDPAECAAKRKALELRRQAQRMELEMAVHRAASEGLADAADAESVAALYTPTACDEEAAANAQ